MSPIKRRWQDMLLAERRPSHHALLADLLLAAVLTALAVAAAASMDTAHSVELLRLPPPPRPVVPVPPPLPDLPTPPPLPDLPHNLLPADGDPVDPGLLFIVALTTLPLAVRRLYPLTAFWVVLLAALATDDEATWVTVASCAIAAYGAVAYSRNRLVALGGLVLATVLAGAAFKDAVAGLPSWLGPFVVLLSAGVMASFVRFWRQQLAERDERLHQAVQVERSRIAGELHDVVTHNVNVMVIQAGAARKVMDTAPDRAKQAMLAVETSGRAAMAELRHVMGLLAASGSGSDVLEPQPGLDQLDSLIERVRAAGVPVSAEISTPKGPVPPGAGLAVYRVVQEALTNTIKHAGGAAVSVAISHTGDWLDIEVADSGGAPAARAGAGQGRGLIGLRERLALYDGTLEAGPRSGGGFLTRARLRWTA
ncbi:sensor histidine kinase [Nonomuraea sp. NPDC050153]|uniref:sensor histidine kinase n=1 Tax=Nonomuraea sp. NPDC050153 TaxID=3364359 RepID=UPI0037A42368